jgi:branched-chain amino acid transport system permease protein
VTATTTPAAVETAEPDDVGVDFWTSFDDALPPPPSRSSALVTRASVVRGLVLLGFLAGSFVLGQVVSLVASDDHQLIALPVQVQALALGCVNALFALGIVLVYRANRIINFAHASFGAMGAVASLILIREYDFTGAAFYVAIVAGIAFAGVLGAVVELILRRFASSSRLVFTVATLGVAQLLRGAVVPLLVYVLSVDLEESNLFGRAESPLTSISWDWFPVVFTGDHLLLVGVTVLVCGGMAAFFRLTSAGIAVRAASENLDRAALLGVNTRTLSTVVWVLAGVLSGVATVLQVPLTGIGDEAAAGVGSGLLLRALAAAVFARFENMPMVVVAALSINVFEQSVFFAFGRNDIVDVVLFVVILTGLLLQRTKLERSQVGESGTWAATEEIRPIPPELAPLPAVRKGVRWVYIVGAVVVLGYPWIASPSQVNLGGLFAIYGIVAVSLVILIGWGGQISLGQWAFAAVGALVGGAMTSTWNLPFLLALLGGSSAGAGVAVLLGLPALRIRGLFLAVTTLAFSVVVSTVLLSDRYFGWMLPDVVHRPKLAFIDTEDERAFYYLTILGLALAVSAAQGLRRSRTGRVLIAMRDNERAAQSLGVNLVRTRLATFALSGFLASFAGVLFAHHQHDVSQQAFLPDDSVSMFLMAVIGGLGSVVGVLSGPIYQGLITTFLPTYGLLASAVGVLMVLYLIPGGFGAFLYAIRDAFLRRVAIRSRIFVPSLLADYRTDGEMSKIPLTPKYDADGGVAEIPERYRLRSRVRVSGGSQVARRWGF